MDDQKHIAELLYQALAHNESGEMDRLKTVIDTIEEEINPDRISIHWSVEDVMSHVPRLTEEQAGEVLGKLDSNHDCNVGITWETIDTVADIYFPDRMEGENELQSS